MGGCAVNVISGGGLSERVVGEVVRGQRAALLSWEGGRGELRLVGRSSAPAPASTPALTHGGVA